MQRIENVNPAEATGKAKQLLTGVQAKMGMTPNLMKAMAQAPAALDAYLHFSGSISTGVLDEKFRQQLAIAVAQANSCEYCLSAHTLIGGKVGLSAEELSASRQSHDAEAKRNAGLQFAQKVVVQRGIIGDEDFAAVKTAGYTDAEIVEIVANVALNIFTNYFNNIAKTEVDFPRVQVTLAQTA